MLTSNRLTQGFDRNVYYEDDFKIWSMRKKRSNHWTLLQRRATSLSFGREIPLELEQDWIDKIYNV